ncbi:hypothetical protein Tcan_04891 [Toxocara canis]|uniref:Uncharacterized protein n=1 Tax=Toxocara canis TaxID=6265 RepID=A0A0B2W5I3_TOXCA|nr:hypothetical protein Tcan_04891 [Toxocara canis]
MAANECQRWLEVTCREIFIDSDDFLYSLRHGSHLRKIVNKIIPDCFDLSPERFKRAPRTTRKTLQNAGLRQTILEKYIEDGDWASQLLLICWLRLHIPRHRLFLPSDLLKLENFSGPYKSFIIQSCESDELTVDKCETSESGQIRRLGELRIFEEAILHSSAAGTYKRAAAAVLKR